MGTWSSIESGSVGESVPCQGPSTNGVGSWQINVLDLYYLEGQF